MDRLLLQVHLVSAQTSQLSIYHSFTEGTVIIANQSGENELYMTLQETEALARSIVWACPSPAACDIVRIVRSKTSVLVYLVDETVQLDPEDNHFFADLSLLKSLVASLTRHCRANAMMAAADLPLDAAPLWLIATNRFTAEWIRWAGVGDQLRAQARWAEDPTIWPQLPTSVEIGGKVSGRSMALAAGFYVGELTASIALPTNQVAYFSRMPEPSIKIAETELPESVIDALNDSGSLKGHAPRRLSKIVSHPFFDVYDPTVIDITNEGSTLVFAIDDARVTLAPVPAAAMAILPIGVDPSMLWELTESEIDTLRNL